MTPVDRDRDPPTTTVRPRRVAAVDGRGRGRRPRGLAGPVRRPTRVVAGPVGVSMFDPTGDGHRGADGIGRVLRRRHRPEPGALRHPAVARRAATRWPTSAPSRPRSPTAAGRSSTACTRTGSTPTVGSSPSAPTGRSMRSGTSRRRRVPRRRADGHGTSGVARTLRSRARRDSGERLWVTVGSPPSVGFVRRQHRGSLACSLGRDAPMKARVLDRGRTRPPRPPRAHRPGRRPGTLSPQRPRRRVPASR